MHPSSYALMQDFVDRCLAAAPEVEVLDVGSADVNGTYRPLFERPGWRYTGLDIAPGPNVDVVVAGQLWPLPEAIFDAVISGSAFEHISRLWQTITEIRFVLKPGGYCCLIAPASGPEHRHPVDCWRILPDGWRALADYAGLEVIEAKAYPPAADPLSRVWSDCRLIARRRPA
jgi:SAM-dependent methyltransferase